MIQRSIRALASTSVVLGILGGLAVAPSAQASSYGSSSSAQTVVVVVANPPPMTFTTASNRYDHSDAKGRKGPEPVLCLPQHGRHGPVMADQFSDLVRRVWHGFDIRDGEAVTVGADDIIAVTVGTMTESFDLDGSSPPAVLAAKLADRFQTILMEARQALLPACPRHGDAHPLVSAVVEGRAVWICPQDDSAVADILP